MPIIGVEPPQIPPSLNRNVDNRIKLALERINTSLPAVIVSFDPIKQTARVKPTVVEHFDDGVSKTFAEIVAVPVIFPSAGGGSLTFPVKEGDECVVYFSQRCFDTWLVSGNVPSKPSVQRYHDYNDAFCMVGLKSFPNSLKASTENVELRFDNDSGEMISKISMQPDGTLIIENDKSNKVTLKDGKFRIENDEEELISILSELIETVANNTTNTVYGTSPMNSKPQLEALKTRLDKLKG